MRCFTAVPINSQPLACDEVWTSDLPHVIYGQIVVDPGCTLTVMPGARVHGHDGSGIWVRGGTLLAQGQLGQPHHVQWRSARRRLR